MSFYAFAVNDAAVVEGKNWMLSLGGFPPLLFLCIIYDFFCLCTTWPHPLLFLLLWLFLSKTALFVFVAVYACLCLYVYMATHNDMYMCRNRNCTSLFLLHMA